LPAFNRYCYLGVVSMSHPKYTFSWYFCRTPLFNASTKPKLTRVKLYLTTNQNYVCMPLVPCTGHSLPYWCKKHTDTSPPLQTNTGFCRHVFKILQISNPKLHFYFHLYITLTPLQIIFAHQQYLSLYFYITIIHWAWLSWKKPFAFVF